MNNNHANVESTNVVVVPLTSNIMTIYPFQVYLPKEQTHLDQDSKAQIELIRSKLLTYYKCLESHETCWWII
ncbi:MAG: type II toxin-antitoxin system PemK/MazF family toxin [Trueperaceae bacterium]